MKHASLVAILLLGGCSLANSFDDVKTAVEGTGGRGGGGKKGAGGGDTDASSGAGGAGGRGPGSGGNSAAGGVAGAVSDAGSDGSISEAGGASPVAEGGTDASEPFVPGGPGGAVVVYQKDGLKKWRVWVLDPKDGSALSVTDTRGAVSIAHDPSTDLWYIFQVPETATGPVQLQVRELSLPSGRWRDRGDPVDVPVPGGGIGMLNGRIAYLSQLTLTSSDQAALKLTVLNTANPDKVSVNLPQRLDLPVGLKFGLSANPESGTKIGGSVTVAIEDEVCAPLCGIGLLRVTVGVASTQIDTSAGVVNVGSVSATGGLAGLTYDGTSRADVVILPPSDVTGASPNCSTEPTSQGTVRGFSTTATHDATGNPVAFNMASLRVSGAAFDYCHGVAFATSLNTTPAVWSIPLAGGTPSRLCRTEPGAGLIYEPYTHSLLRIASSGDLETYNIVDTTPTAPTVASKAAFVTPSGFSAADGIVAVRLGSAISAERPKCP